MHSADSITAMDASDAAARITGDGSVPIPGAEETTATEAGVGGAVEAVDEATKDEQAGPNPRTASMQCRMRWRIYRNWCMTWWMRRT